MSQFMQLIILINGCAVVAEVLLRLDKRASAKFAIYELSWLNKRIELLRAQDKPVLLQARVAEHYAAMIEKEYFGVKSQ